MSFLGHFIFYSVNDKENILYNITVIVTAYEVNIAF